MEEGPSWEATSRTTNQEIPFFVEPEQSLMCSKGPATDSYREGRDKVHSRTGHVGPERK